MTEKKHMIEVDASDTAYVAWGNSDLTEGRGHAIPLKITRSMSAAERLGKGKSVQGCDASVSPVPIFRLGGYWYGPVVLTEPEPADKVLDAKRAERLRVVERAKSLGLGTEDIEILSGVR